MDAGMRPSPVTNHHLIPRSPKSEPKERK
jgi:hypothetical protein